MIEVPAEMNRLQTLSAQLCLMHTSHFPSVKFHQLRSGRVHSGEAGQCTKVPASTFWGSFGVTDLWLSVRTDNSESDVCCYENRRGSDGMELSEGQGTRSMPVQESECMCNPLSCTVYWVNLPLRHYGSLLRGSAKFVVLWKGATGGEKSTKKVIEGRFLCDGYIYSLNC